MSAEVLELTDLFDSNNELRIREDESGWSGFEHRDGRYYFVDTRRPESDWTRRFIVGPGAVRNAVERYVRGES